MAFFIQIHKEILAVLNHCVQNRDIWQEQTGNFCTCYKYQVVIIIFLYADLSIMCAQTIFTVLDHLHAWAVGKNKAAVIRRMRNQPQKG